MLSTAVASPCQTLHELLAGDPAHQLAVPRMRSLPRVCTLVLFHFFMCQQLVLVGWVYR